jgi:hypothetical protein
MTAKDNITLPRELVFRAVKALTPMAYDTWPRERNEVVEALRTALAAEPQKQEPVAMFDERMGQPVLLPRSPMLEDGQFLYTAPPAPAPEDIEDLRRDAERYRWIRDNHEIKGRAMEIVYNSNGKEWDAAIDAAMEDKT